MTTRLNLAVTHQYLVTNFDILVVIVICELAPLLG